MSHPPSLSPADRPRSTADYLKPPIIFFCVWLFLLLAGRSAMLRDPGTFWHVVAGEKMLSTGQVPREDCYSFTFAGRPWVDNQWLAECGMAAVHRLAGWDGLLLLSAALLATLYAWIAARLLRAGLHWLPTCLLLALLLLIGSPQFHVRPLIVTIGLLGLTFAWLVDVEAGVMRLRQLWWLVPLFIVWTNLHGGVMAGIGTVGLCAAGWCVANMVRSLQMGGTSLSPNEGLCAAGWCMANMVRSLQMGGTPLSPSEGRGEPSKPRQQRVAELVLLVMTLAATALVNPYGIGLPHEWLDTLTMPLPSLISEHMPLDLGDPIGVATIVLAAGYLIVLLGVYPNRPRVVWLLPLVWFVLALQRVRNAPLFSITAAIALADMLRYSRVGRWLGRREMFGKADGSPFRWRSAWLPLAVVAAALAIQAAGVRLPVIGRGWAQFNPTHWPVALLPELEEVNRSVADGTPIFNDLNLGGFLIYHAPHLRVFVDDRCTVYGGDFLQTYDHARREDPAQIDRWQHRYGFQYALVATDGGFDRYLAGADGWTAVARTPPATLYRQDMGVSPPMR